MQNNRLRTSAIPSRISKSEVSCRIGEMGSACNGIFRRALPANVEVCGENQELHVLAVDDSLVDRKVIERLLKISSCKVTAVESGKRALQYLGLLDGERSSNGLDRLEVNLIITDYSMPGMTGYELMKKIKESSTLREIPVVIMSSENILARIDRCLEDGAKDYIVKPVKLADVRRLKDSMIKGNFGAEIKEMVSMKRPTSDCNSLLSLASITQPPLAPASSITKPPSVSPLASPSKEYKSDSPRRVLRLRRHDYRS